MHLSIEESPASWVVKLFGEVGGGVPVGGGGGGHGGGGGSAGKIFATMLLHT